jgi:DNA-binding transcriptional ArsR family regulator
MDEKILKLTSAVYKLLEYFPESDPLKNKAKEKALEILENRKTEDVDLLLGYLQIARNQGWLDSTNYLIIFAEYEKIKKIKFLEVEKENPKIILDKYQITPRQKKILKLLEQKESAQVMDLQAVLPKITKRTIRRDLDELLQAGKIIRVGQFNQVSYKIGQSIGHK